MKQRKIDVHACIQNEIKNMVQDRPYTPCLFRDDIESPLMPNESPIKNNLPNNSSAHHMIMSSELRQSNHLKIEKLKFKQLEKDVDQQVRELEVLTPMTYSEYTED